MYIAWRADQDMATALAVTFTQTSLHLLTPSPLTSSPSHLLTPSILTCAVSMMSLRGGETCWLTTAGGRGKGDATASNSPASMDSAMAHVRPSRGRVNYRRGEVERGTCMAGQRVEARASVCIRTCTLYVCM